MNDGHSFNIPTDQQFVAIMQQLWSEQYQALSQAVQRYGLQALLLIDLHRWQQALISRVIPIYRKIALEGQLSFEQHAARSKHWREKRGAGVQLLPATADRPAVGQVNEYLEVYDPRVTEFARTWAYDFAASTIATSQTRVLDLYQQMREILPAALEEGSTLDQTTALLAGLFNDPLKAAMVAASESSRAYHGGQLITARESGEVTGKTWLASSDACEACLALNGKTVALDAPFVVRAGRYGVVMYPPLHPHCMCSLEYEMLPLESQSSVAAAVTQPNGWRVWGAAA